MKQIVIRLDVPDEFTDIDVAKRIARLCDRKELEKHIEVDGLTTRRNSFASIARATSRVFDVSLDELKGRGRSNNLIKPRHVIYYLANTELKLSLTNIGRLMNRDHTSILHGVNSVREKMRIDFQLAKDCEKVLALSQEIEDERQKFINEQAEKHGPEVDRTDQVDARGGDEQAQSWRLPSYREVLARQVPVVRKVASGNIISAE